MNAIHIFVSSTFSDMQRERDILHEIAGIMSRQNAGCGYCIQLHDLRHGIDTSGIEDEQRAEEIVLERCFQEIDRCRPLFLILLGDRYGMIPRNEGKTAFLFTDKNIFFHGQSVTALEIEYGTCRKQDQCVLVVSRTFENNVPEDKKGIYCETDPEKTAKLQELKDYLKPFRNQISYTARWNENGALEIDEDLFRKHIRGFLEKIIADAGPNMIARITDSDTHGTHSEYESGFPTEILTLAGAKAEHAGARLRECYYDLLLCRLGRLLDQDDYRDIRRIGTDGNAITTYQKQLLIHLPQDFIGLLKEVCTQIEKRSCPGVSLYEILLIIAQTDGLLSYDDIYRIYYQEKFPETFRYDQINQAEFDGYQTDIQRGLAFFFGDFPMLEKTPWETYLISRKEILNLLAQAVSEQVAVKIAYYLTSVPFFAFDVPIQAWHYFFTNKMYDKCCRSLDEIFYARKVLEDVIAHEAYLFSEKSEEALIGLILYAAQQKNFGKIIAGFLSDFLYQLITEGKGSKHVISLLENLLESWNHEGENEILSAVNGQIADILYEIIDAYYDQNGTSPDFNSDDLINCWFCEIYEDIPDEKFRLVTKILRRPADIAGEEPSDEQIAFLLDFEDDDLPYDEIEYAIGHFTDFLEYFQILILRQGEHIYDLSQLFYMILYLSVKSVNVPEDQEKQYVCRVLDLLSALLDVSWADKASVSFWAPFLYSLYHYFYYHEMWKQCHQMTRLSKRIIDLGLRLNLFEDGEELVRTYCSLSEPFSHLGNLNRASEEKTYLEESYYDYLDTASYY